MDLLRSSASIAWEMRSEVSNVALSETALTYYSVRELLRVFPLGNTDRS